MEIRKIHDRTFTTDESIMTVSLSGPHELVMLMSSGNVIRYNIEEQKGKHLFSTKSVFSYEDGGFDVDAPSTIYTLGSIVVIVNDYKLHGFIHYPENYKSLHFRREDYHANISRYPIALFKNESGIPHLIYAEAWNHIQIMNLDTRQILTAAKSLIEEDAEERHIEFYKTYKEENKLAWPTPYDYFFGRLEMSPDKKNFLSAGWVWGSNDLYNIYEVNHFINNSRIAHKNISYWEHSTRATCWIDDKTVAITYSPFEERDEGATKDSPHEIHFYKVDGKASEVERKVQVIGLDIVSSNMHFNKKLNALILFSDNIGIAAISLNGEILFRDETMYQDAYYADLNLFVKTDDKSVVLHEIEE